MKLHSLLLIMLLPILAPAQSINLSAGNFFDGEPFLAINPQNSQNMVVAWMGYTFGQPIRIKSKTTFDGGTTWSATTLLPHMGTSFKSADVSMAFDNAGNVFICYIDYHQSPDSGGVYVLKSTNGGSTWANAVKVIDVADDATKAPLDRPWLSIDKSGGPNNGHQYVTTKPAPWIPAPNRAYFMHSTNNGASFLPWRYLDTTNYLIGNFIAAPMAANTVAANGTLHCMYPSYVVSQNLLPGFIDAVSTNGGASFQYHPAIFSSLTANDTLAKLGYRLISNPANAQHVAFIFCHPFNGDIDVALSESTDGGVNWSAPIRINDDATGNGKMQDLVWADFDTDGDLLITWRDRRNGTGTGYQNPSEIWGAVRWKDSTTFSANFMVSDTLAPYNNAFLSQSGNDFMCAAMCHDTLNAVWGDVLGNKLNIYFTRKALRSGATTVQKLTEEFSPQVSIAPNPAKDWIVVESKDALSISIFDIAGKRLLNQLLPSQNETIDIKNLPKGILIVHVITRQGAVDIKCVKE